MRRESIPFESRALFIAPWVVFFLHLVRDPVSHKFTCSTPLKSNWTCGRKLTQICDSISFNCWVGPSSGQSVCPILAKLGRTDRRDPKARDPRRYNRPTVDEVAAIIVQPENDNEPLDRDIIIQRRHTGRLRRISEHSPCYIPMRYPLIFPHGEPGWHPLIPLSDIDLRQWQFARTSYTHNNSYSRYGIITE